MIPFKLIISCCILTIVLLISSCSKKCEECYFIEDDGNGNISTTAMGEFCGNDIKAEESKFFVVVNGSARVECRE